MPHEKVYIKVRDEPTADTDHKLGTPEFEAGRWLAYADQTDTIGYDAVVLNATHIDGATHVTLKIPQLRGDEREAFITEMDHLSRVETLKFEGVM